MSIHFKHSIAHYTLHVFILLLFTLQFFKQNQNTSLFTDASSTELSDTYPVKPEGRVIKVAKSWSWNSTFSYHFTTRLQCTAKRIHTFSLFWKGCFHPVSRKAGCLFLWWWFFSDNSWMERKLPAIKNWREIVASSTWLKKISDLLKCSAAINC